MYWQMLIYNAFLLSNWLTHWWMVLRLTWGTKLAYNIPGKEICQSVLKSKR